MVDDNSNDSLEVRLALDKADPLHKIRALLQGKAEPGGALASGVFELSADVDAALGEFQRPLAFARAAVLDKEEATTALKGAWGLFSARRTSGRGGRGW